MINKLITINGRYKILDITNILNQRPMIPSTRHVWLLEEIYLARDRQNMSLEHQVQVSSSNMVKGLNATRSKYIALQTPLKIHAWCFEAMFMAFNSLIISLGTKVCSSSLENHSQGLETPTNYSKHLVLTNILDHILIIQSNHHVCLVDTTSLALDG